MTLMDILFLIAVILGVILISLYFLNQWATRKYGAQQELIESSKNIGGTIGRVSATAEVNMNLVSINNCYYINTITNTIINK